MGPTRPRTCYSVPLTRNLTPDPKYGFYQHCEKGATASSRSILLMKIENRSVRLLIAGGLLLALTSANAQTTPGSNADSLGQSQDPALLLPPTGQPTPVTNTVGLTTNMEVLNDQTKLGNGDTVSYRVVEERKDPIPLTVTDSGEMEVPYIGRVQAAGKTCKELAFEIKPLLEKDYFYHATVIVGLYTLSNKPRGKVYLMGQVHSQGAMEIPSDEVLTVSKVILRAGGLADFANRRKVKLVRQTPDGKTQTTIVDLEAVLDKGHMDKDPVVQPNDLIVVPERLVNF
jgi:polysaccharide export outer membrane protein